MLVAKGSALLQAKKLPAAIKIFQDAEGRLDQRLQTIPIGEGRTRFLSARNEGAQGLVLALLASGRKEAAFAASRRARARNLQSATLGERVRTIDGAQRTRWLSALQKFNEARRKLEKASAEDWRLSRDELATALMERQDLKELCQAQLDNAFSELSNTRATSSTRLPPVNLPPASGELLLLYSRRSPLSGNRTAQAWDAFAATTAGVRHVVLLSPDLSATKHETHPWLLPFAREIAAATRIRVLPTNNLTEEIHAFAFHNRPLLMHAPVVYSLDIKPAAAAEGRPLIVADPTGDLPLAQLEGRGVADSLSALSPTRLEGAAAERSRVLDLLSHTNWFHYAGHSVFAGVEGLDSGLPLAQGQRLSAADVLGLPASPALVVLSSCEAGRSAGDSNMAGLGLAQAFVLAGSRAVVAPTRPVQDLASRQLMQLMYQHLRSGLPAEKALQAAQLDPKLPHQRDWSAFRVLVP